jgi:hypothetical protein
MAAVFIGIDRARCATRNVADLQRIHSERAASAACDESLNRCKDTTWQAAARFASSLGRTGTRFAFP